MKEKSIFTPLGIVIYVLLSVVDRFIVQLPDYIYIPIAIVGIGCIIFGFIKDRAKNKNYEN